jgi:hypothetical protein
MGRFVQSVEVSIFKNTDPLHICVIVFLFEYKLITNSWKNIEVTSDISRFPKYPAGLLTFPRVAT